MHVAAIFALIFDFTSQQGLPGQPLCLYLTYAKDLPSEVPLEISFSNKNFPRLLEEKFQLTRTPKEAPNPKDTLNLEG
jgi:hypothetical protein